jgi:glycosyltransferase involved in cell wall biosynthesis
MSSSTTVVQYWAGTPKSPNSKWQRFVEIVRRCRKEGWSTLLVWSQWPENLALAEPFREAGCEIVVLPRARGNFDVADIGRTYKFLRRVRCDVFHCYNDHTSPLIGAALARVPVRLWSKLAMSSHYEKGTNPQGLHRLALGTRISSALSTCILARSEAVKQELIRDGADPNRVVVVPVDVDVSSYGTALGSSEVRHELGYLESDLIITSVGHAAPVKGWDVLLASFGEVARQDAKARLLLVGDIPTAGETAFADSLHALASRNGWGDRVRFLGRRDDIPRLLAISDIFVLPSRSEGQPGALVEAMATGLPCVAARVGGIPEVIRDGHDGLLVDRGDSEALGHAILRLVKDKQLKAELSRRAKDTARKFDIVTSTEQLFRRYVELLSRARN